ncbi:MAG TPA: sugar transferase [Bryobacteraceae bacterium]|nr:sugar transferase [Bryobacteraceae bacterium]
MSKRGWDSAQRALDLVLVTATATIWIPVLCTLLLAKYLMDGGPVLFTQYRVGRFGKPFLLYKIRTTHGNYRARPEDWPTHNFPPRTRFGRFIRRADLDELPQLLNVFKGEMSLVGPRPETPHHDRKLSRSVRRYTNRLEVLPGLTGLAQIRGWRGDTSIEMRVASDLEFIATRRFRVYAGILARTVATELKRICGKA